MIVKERKKSGATSEAAALAAADPGMALGMVQSINADGMIAVALDDGRIMQCLWLSGGPQHVLAAGDKVLVARAGIEHVVMGVVGPYRVPELPKRLTLEATEVLTLKCGEVSVDLRASDGKLMLRGEDVLLRAKGMQRIKAGSVSIN